MKEKEILLQTIEAVIGLLDDFIETKRPVEVDSDNVVESLLRDKTEILMEKAINAIEGPKRMQFQGPDMKLYSLTNVRNSFVEAYSIIKFNT